MTQPEDFLTELKAHLSAERERLQRELERLESTRLAGASAYTEDRGYGTHLADDASGTEQEEVDLALEHSVRERLAAVDEALHRFERGHYGVCERCGKEIAAERLRVMPWASLCIECQTKKERPAGHA
ncbi:MAG: hypothetical protein EPO21_16775 [Chloroflexota bacterium]|nr:MAG: hypothetical protein EPO21_16775 [Chloroflexota bacterium]